MIERLKSMNFVPPTLICYKETDTNIRAIEFAKSNVQE